ncbi:MAG: hypothetical protein ABJN69_09750 [Hellea sp.]
MSNFLKGIFVAAVLSSIASTQAYAGNSVPDFDLAGRYGQQLERSMDKCGDDKKCRDVTFSRYGLMAAYEDSAKAWEDYDRALYRVAKSTCDSSTSWMNLYAKIYNIRTLYKGHRKAKGKTKDLYRKANKALRYAKKKGYISRTSFRKIQSVRDKSKNLYRKTTRHRAMFGLIVSSPGTATKNIRGCRGL